MIYKKLILLAISSLCFSEAFSQKQTIPDTALFNGLKFRCLGPSRGGRSAAVTGVVGEPKTFYFGGTGGGVWRTTDGGNSWNNISDGFFGGSIGSVAVSESDLNVIYVGGGENTLRGNVSEGSGMWKSEDNGATWKSIGLKDSRHITKIVIDKKNPDNVWVAVLGHLFGPNEERGIYRTRDGGKTWQRTLFVNNQVGAVDLVQDPFNPRNFYATTWKVRRTPYSLESGGEGSGIWKSTDYGETWVNISTAKGFPKAPLGIIGVTASPAKRDRLWAIAESAEGGVFRSDDAGKNWTKTSSEANLRQRAWYFSKIYADSKDPDKVYVLNVQFHRSDDGGSSFTVIGTPHGDHHEFWIDPNEPNRMIIGDDGGAQVSTNAGASWTTYYNQPTAQFYRLATDNDYPYHILTAQQDNSTVRIEAFSKGGGLGWEGTAGFESGHLAASPKDPDLVFGGNYCGFLNWYNHRTKESRNVNVWPDNPLGHGVKDSKYRFQWNFPIFFSPNDPNTLYAAGNVLFKSTNEGQSWTPISPDLTRNDTTKQEPSGGPITKDNTSVEFYCTIFAAAESPAKAGVLWAGSDDGLIHVSQDAGANWTNVTPSSKLMPEWTMINCIEPHPSQPGTVYIAATAYKNDNYTPYLLKSSDYGKTWKLITKGINPLHFTRAIRADRVRPGLLYAGTEAGLYVSYDDGENWINLQLNLPIVPITDLHIKDNDLIVATQGRSLWALDNLTPLQESNAETFTKKYHLFQPRDAWRSAGGGDGGGVGRNPVGPAMIEFFLKDTAGMDTLLRLEFLDKNNQLISRYTPQVTDDQMKKNKSLGKLGYAKGFNRFGWDMRYPAAETFEGLLLWDGGGLGGPLAVPGEYFVKMVIGKDSIQKKITIKKDPKTKNSQADIEAQFNFLSECRDKLTAMHRAISEIRKVRGQLGSWKDRFDPVKHKALIDQANAIIKKLTSIEETLYQTKSKSPQDPINFPIKLNDKLSSLSSDMNNADFPPTAQAIEVKNELVRQIDAELDKLSKIYKEDIEAFNKAVHDANVPAVAPNKL